MQLEGPYAMRCDTLALEILASIQGQCVMATIAKERPKAVLMSEFTFRWLLEEFFPGEYHPSERFTEPLILGLRYIQDETLAPGDVLVAV